MASIILSITLVGTASIFIMGSRNISVTANKTAALNLANQTLRMLAVYVADEPFAAPEDAWFSAAVRQPAWQSCTAAAGPWGDCYALTAGNHFVAAAVLPADFSAAPISGNIQYSVMNVVAPPALAGWKRVQVSVDWTEPQ